MHLWRIWMLERGLCPLVWSWATSNRWYAQSHHVMHDKPSLQPNHYRFEVRHGRLLKAELHAATVSR